MSPALRAVVDAADELAWWPIANLSPPRYGERLACADRLRAALRAWSGRLSANASAELRYLVDAIWRAAACSWCNRMGFAYYERREAIWQLRGCLDVWKRSVAA